MSDTINDLIWAGVLRTQQQPANLVNTVLNAGSAVLIGPGSAGYGTFNILDYGGDPTGVLPSSEAAQQAAAAIGAAGRGVLLIPPGQYLWNASVFLPSNTVVMMYGAKINTTPHQQFTPAAPDAWSIFVNENFGALTLTDENYEIWGGEFNYANIGMPVPNGGAHAINFQFVSNIKVGHGTLLYGDDYIACRGCEDVLVIGNSAYYFENAAWDFWWGCKNVRVIGCYSYSGDTVQHANFQCSQTFFPTGQVAENFVMQGCTMIHPPGGSRTYSSIFLDPFGTGNISKNIIIQGCQLHNVIIAARGDVRDTLIQGCQFFGTPGAAGVSPIFSYADAGNTPDGIVVDNCLFVEPQSAAPGVAVIDVRGTNNRVTNNRITGSAHSVPTYSFGGNAGVAYGNTDPLGTWESTTTFIGDEPIRSPNDRGFSMFDTAGTWSRLYVSSTDDLTLFARDASGLPRLVFSIPARSDDGVLNLWQETRVHAPLLRTVGVALTATGATRADALQLEAFWNNVTTVAAGTGVKLTTRTLGTYSMVVRNGGANALNVYPANGSDQIDALGAGNPYVLAPGEVGRWAMVDNGQWYTESVHP